MRTVTTGHADLPAAERRVRRRRRILVSEMIYNAMLMGTLNSTHSVARSLIPAPSRRFRRDV